MSTLVSSKLALCLIANVTEMVQFGLPVFTGCGGIVVISIVDDGLYSFSPLLVSWSALSFMKFSTLVCCVFNYSNNESPNILARFEKKNAPLCSIFNAAHMFSHSSHSLSRIFWSICCI